MTPEQVRGARNWLGWTQKELAAAADVGLSTIIAYENGERDPMKQNLKAIQSALEEAGIEFTPDAIRRRK